MTVDLCTEALIPEDIAKDMLRRHGIPTPGTTLCREAVDVEEFLLKNGASSYVLKLSLDLLIHKSAVGGVQIGVAPEDVPATFAQLDLLGRELEATYGTFRGVLIEPYVGDGTEVVLGFQLDEGLGPVVMVGDGGTDIEETRRVVFAAAPLTADSAKKLVGRWCALPGSAGVSVTRIARDRIADLLLRIAGDDGLAFADKCASIDVNPVIVSGDDVVAVDAVIQSPPAAAADWGERLTTSQKVKGNITAFLDPKSIAMVGASTDPTKPGSILLQNLRDFGYTGELYPVHPHATEIGGLPAFPSITSIPNEVQKAIVMVGRDQVPEVVRQCVSKGVDAVQVYSSGFSEYTDSGTLEQEILDALSGSATRLMGPNCWGAYSPRARITTNAARYSGTESGHVAFVSQSGTHFVDVVRRSKLCSLPLYGAMSVGNCLDLQAHELARHLLDQDDVHVLGMYLEGTSHAREIVEIATTSSKPIVVMRGGGTTQGSRAAASHTAALVGDDSVWASLMTAAGIVLVDTIEDMMDTLSALATLPPIHGNRLAVFGTGGGVGVVSADIAARNGLVLSDFAPELSMELANRFGQPGTSMTNPMDVTVWDMFPNGKSALSEVLSLIGVPGVADSAIAFLELGSVLDMNSPDRAQQLIELLITDLEQNRCQIPLSVVLRTGGDPESEGLLREMQRRLRGVGVTTYSRIQDAITTHARIVTQARL